MEDIMHNWKGILLLSVILSAGCVRIDMPEIVFVKQKTYATKKECRVFHEKEGFFPFFRDGGWWIEGVDYSNRMIRSSEPEVDIKPQTILPVGTLLQENRSEMQYGFSLWYLFTLNEAHRMKILNGEMKGMVVFSDNLWSPEDEDYDPKILELYQNAPSTPDVIK